MVRFTRLNIGLRAPVSLDHVFAEWRFRPRGPGQDFSVLTSDKGSGISRYNESITNCQ